MSDDSDRIGEFLRYDPLATAEALTGASYKEDRGTMALGLALGLDANERKRRALEANDDTHYSIPFEDARRIFRSLGFEELVRIETASRYDAGIPMTFIVAWSQDGILLDFDSYDGNLNSGKMHYNWRADEGLEDRWTYQSSGHWTEDGLLIGDHDVREGLRYTLDRMRANGRFVNPWQKRPFLWLNPHHDEDYQSATENVIAQLPAAVRAAITPVVAE